MLRVGVIGCGSIAKQRHGYEYFHNANVEIKGFFDRRQERVEALTWWDVMVRMLRAMCME